MRTVADIALGLAGQVLTFDAPEGRPSSVTSATVYRWDVGDDDDNETAIGAPAIETNPNTTTDAAAGPAQADPRRVPVTATTGCAVDRRYLLTDADGRREWIDVREVDAGDAVIARHPLLTDFATGATFQTTRLTATVDTAWCSDETNLDPTAGANPMYRVRWVYVVAGASYVADTYFNLVRYGARHGVRPQDVDLMVPGWLDRLPIDHRVDQGRRLIDEAHRAVKIDLHAISVDDAAVAEAEVIDELVRYKAVELSELARYLSSPGDDGTRLAKAEERYQGRFDTLVRLTQKVPVRDTDGAAVLTQAIGLTRR